MTRESSYLSPGLPYRGGHLLHNLLLFGRICRTLGLTVTVDRMIECAHALTLIDLGRKVDVYHALRALLIFRQVDIPLFDEAFQLFWRKRGERWSRLDLRSLGEEGGRKDSLAKSSGRTTDGGSGPRGASERPTRVLVPLYGADEALRTRDFAEMSGDELRASRQLISRSNPLTAMRRTRRFQPGKGSRIDVRRLLRGNLSWLGEPLFIPRRMRRLKPRRLVLICDISGSMESYTRVLLQFMHTLTFHRMRIESFVFSTRLTRITKSLRRKSVDQALREVGGQVQDWGGGTRIGHCLREFNFHWSRRVLGGGSIVLLITDGWDRGEPDLLDGEAGRLHRSVHRLIWLNPLLGRTGYQPLTAGARTLLPHTDRFLPVNNLASLDELAQALREIGDSRR